MFQIVNNRLLENGTVLYRDEKENTIKIFASLNGEELKVKLRLNNGVRVSALHFSPPYAEEGVNFHVEKEMPAEMREASGSFKIDEETQSVLNDCLVIIEKWLQIEISLYQINAVHLNSLFAMTGGEADFEGKLQFTINMLESLKKFEEMREIVKIYETAMKAD